MKLLLVILLALLLVLLLALLLGLLLASLFGVTVNVAVLQGYFFLPTIITGLDDNSRVNQEEIFGPVVTIAPFTTEAEVNIHLLLHEYKRRNG